VAIARPDIIVIIIETSVPVDNIDTAAEVGLGEETGAAVGATTGAMGVAVVVVVVGVGVSTGIIVGGGTGVVGAGVGTTSESSQQ